MPLNAATHSDMYLFAIVQTITLLYIAFILTKRRKGK